MKSMYKAIFLDRDGVLNKPIIINGMPHSPKNLSETELLFGVKEACQQLINSGFLLICVTNQPNVSRGIQTIETINEINNWIKINLRLHSIRTCFHDNDDNCLCRKPKPGLLISAANDYNIDFTKSFMVGDRWRDIDAGSVVGCKTIFIDHNYNEPKPKSDYTFLSLFDAIPTILKLTKND